MPALEILKHVRQLAGRGLRIEIQNALDDMIGPGLVRRIEVARFRRRLERTNDDPGGVGPQMQ